MDNMQPGSGSQPEAQSKGTTYNPTSQNPSLNITSDSDKVRVEGIYNSEEVKYTDKRSILNSSFYTFNSLMIYLKKYLFIVLYYILYNLQI